MNLIQIIHEVKDNNYYYSLKFNLKNNSYFLILNVFSFNLKTI